MVKFENGKTPLSEENLNKLQSDLLEDIKKVDEKLIHSTGEQVVGTWIDEKNIYRKTYEIGAIESQGQETFDVSDLNIDTFFINYSKSIVKLTNGFSVGVAFKSVNTNTESGIETDALLVGNTLYVRTGSATAIISGYITIEYTKTTG